MRVGRHRRGRIGSRPRDADLGDPREPAARRRCRRARATARVRRRDLLPPAAGGARSSCSSTARDARAMPRPTRAAARAAASGAARAGRAGAPAGATVELAIAAGGGGACARRSGGSRSSAPAPPPAARPRRRRGLIAVCMATYEPDPALFRRPGRVAPRADRRPTGSASISDDALGPGGASPRSRDVLGDDPRFVVSRSRRAARLLPQLRARAARSRRAEAELIALCDQDDRWHPDKLAVLRDALGGAQLVYSDQRLVDADGARAARHAVGGARATTTPTSSRCWSPTASPAPRRCSGARSPSSRCRSPTRPGCRSTTTGSALVALAAGDVAYVDRPLYDYVQHRGRGLRRRSRTARRRAARSCAAARRVLPRLPPARRAGARCCSPAAARGSRRRKRRALRRFVAAERSPGGVRLARRAPAARARRPHRDAGQRERAGARAAGAGVAVLARRSQPGGDRWTRASRPLAASSSGGCAAGGRGV